ncbi:MAG: hypothetical protein PHG95_00465 [Patescibacteria group bacterium]|nr:hypothetical protein [Patescibacteria group bacterium]
MHNRLESFSALPYSEDLKNREKSIEEIAKFILDHLSSGPDFLSFLRNQELSSSERGERWRERLEKLLSKAQRRVGYRINNRDFILAARNLILQRQAAGELPPQPAYLNFCELSDEDFKLDA